MKILFIIFLIPAFFSCRNNKPVDEYVKFTLDIPIKFEPSRDTINIGDTFYFSTDIGDTLLELNSGIRYPIGDFYLNNSLSVMKLVNKNSRILDQLPGTSGFQFFSIRGRIFDITARFAEVEFEKISGGGHTCKIGVIARRPGIYAFTFFFAPLPVAEQNYLPHINLGSTTSGGRRIAEVRGIRYAINDSITNHFNIFRDNCQLTIDPYNSHWHNRFLYYTVVVK